HGVFLNTHTSLTMFDEILYPNFSLLPWEKSMKEGLFEDLPSNRTTSQFPIISPLYVPSLGHIFELIGRQLSLLKIAPHTNS
ncbi:hypothetical protein, partial [Klebsiella pneumoniae]|uniref:hypothetical protein n=1 Tax=Klebsiella pneumoniae TaxID=573 RepID=UPI003A7F7742